MSMTSKFKDLTANTQPSFSGEGTEAKVQPSEPSARTESTPISTQTSPAPSMPTLPDAKPSVTTVPTTVVLTERSRQHADLVKASLTQLEKAGLIRRFKVLSAVDNTPQKIRIEFDLSIWTEDLELK